MKPRILLTIVLLTPVLLIGNAASTATRLVQQTATAVLSVNSGFPSQPGIDNPLAGKTFVLFRESFAAFLQRTGRFQGPPGSTAKALPLAAWVYSCQIQSPACTQTLYDARPNSVSEAKADLNGRATLPAVPAGTYYLFAIAPYNQKPLVWDLRVDLKPGANSITLNQTNTASLEATSANARSSTAGRNTGLEPCRVSQEPRPAKPSAPSNSLLSVVGMGYTYTYKKTDRRTGEVVDSYEEEGNFSDTDLYLLDQDALEVLQEAGIGPGLLGSPYATMALVDSGTQVEDFPGAKALVSLFGQQEMLAEFTEMARADYDCAMKAVRAHSVAQMKTDAQARGTFPRVPAGTYYLFGRFYRLQKPVRAGGMFWNLRVALKPGQNLVRLSVSNAAWKTGA